ncbi:acyl-CoA dehydrogenase family protein [Niveispirillum fermenti]|uniref:acyl-CoA dehydrogenase family protein n=1 Tax=Niveispirillum fermenti TaxID=1233113 RepID=UPI003A88D748
MPLYLSDEQVMLADTARPFLANLAPVGHMRRLRDSADPAGYSPTLWKQFAEMGFTGILADEADGGLGLGHVEAGIVLEEIGRNLTPSPFLSSAVGAVTALKGATAEQRARFLPGILAGDSVAAIAIDERARHKPQHIALRATRSGNGFRLDGTKNFVPFAHVADLLIIATRTSGNDDDTDGITLFALEREQAGMAMEVARLADASFASRLSFQGVQVGGDAVIGTVEGGRPLLDATLSALRTGTASEMLGVAGGATDMTMAYLRDRMQFGQVIGSFQALQHRAAHLYCELELARAATLKAQQLLDEGADGTDRAACVAKGMAGMASLLAVQEGVQMHGGIGMTDEYDVGFFMKRQRVLAELYGDTDFHADRIARMTGY